MGSSCLFHLFLCRDTPNGSPLGGTAVRPGPKVNKQSFMIPCLRQGPCPCMDFDAGGPLRAGFLPVITTAMVRVADVLFDSAQGRPFRLRAGTTSDCDLRK